MNQDQLAIREETTLARPADVIEGAREQARELMAIVEDRKLFAMIQGKKYLEAEAWEIICAFNNVSPDVVYTNPIYENDEIVAYEAKVNLIDRNGALRGSGISECSMDSFPTKGRTGRDRDKAAKSAAQTWAISKAARMAFSWVAVLAEYEPTPASEMKSGPVIDSAEDYGICEKHGLAYFKSEKMRSPAHRTESGGWCNRPRGETIAEAPSKPAEPDSEPEPEGESQEGFDAFMASEGEEPDPHADPEGEPQRQFRDMKELKAALTKELGVPATKAGESTVNALLAAASGDPSMSLSTVRDLPWVYETVKAAKKGAGNG